MGDIIARGMAGKALRGVSPATIDSAGIVKPDGNSITIDADGTIHATGSAAAVKSELDAYKGTNNAAVAAAKKAGDDAQADVDALEAKVGTVAEGKTVVGLINEAKQAAIDDDTQIKADIAANTSAIATLNGNASTAGSVAKAVADAKSALEAKIKTNADAIAVLNGDGEGSVSKQIADAVAGIVPGAPSDYIKTASVSGNILTLTKNDDTSITFTALSENEVNSLIDAKLEVVENGSY